eukprot:5063182-Amphidinium_carterae.1
MKFILRGQLSSTGKLSEAGTASSGPTPQQRSVGRHSEGIDDTQYKTLFDFVSMVVPTKRASEHFQEPTKKGERERDGAARSRRNFSATF